VKAGRKKSGPSGFHGMTACPASFPRQRVGILCLPLGEAPCPSRLVPFGPLAQREAEDPDPLPFSRQ